MTKNTLRKILTVIGGIWMTIATALIILGKADAYTIVYMCICYLLLAVLITTTIIKRIYARKMFKSFKETFDCLKIAHKSAYMLALEGKFNSQEFKEYSEFIQSCGNEIIKTGEQIIDNRLVKNEEELLKVEAIIIRTKLLMSK